MPSVTYMNQSAPFWDFIASLEQDGQSHPFFSQNQNQNENTERGEEGHPFGPWGWGWGQGRPRSYPHRGSPQAGPSSNEPAAENKDNEKIKEKDQEKVKDNDNGNGEGPSNTSGSDNEGCRRGRGRHGHCGPGRRGGHGFGPSGHHGGPHHHGRGRGWGPWAGRGGPFGGGAPFNPLNFAAGLFDPNNYTSNNINENEDFTPEADIFDTPTSFMIHIPLPGAKKEDVGVNWDEQKSELSVAGVIYRPGDEEFLKTLAMGERKVGPFERKVRLGTKISPAKIDADGISAKLEDGVLRVEVPKVGMGEEEGFVEVRKVDVE